MTALARTGFSTRSAACHVTPRQTVHVKRYTSKVHVNRYMSTGTCQTVHIKRYRLHGTYHTVHVKWYMLHGTCQTARVKRYVSNGAYQTVYFTRYMSNGTCHTVRHMSTCIWFLVFPLGLPFITAHVDLKKHPQRAIARQRVTRQAVLAARHAVPEAGEAEPHIGGMKTNITVAYLVCAILDHTSRGVQSYATLGQAISHTTSCFEVYHIAPHAGSLRHFASRAILLNLGSLFMLHILFSSLDFQVCIVGANIHPLNIHELCQHTLLFKSYTFF